MTATFAEQPILNSPYEYPGRHWQLENGVPTDHIVEQRRLSAHIVPVPPARRQSQQATMTLGVSELSDERQEYDPTPIINDIRRRVDAWRAIPSPNDWGVTPETARLLQHWRSYNFPNVRPFFCQVEAAETVIWLTEVAGLLSTGASRRRREYEGISAHIAGANQQANPELFRIALKLATGTGKTTVMAMLIAWQTVNAVRYPNRRLFTKGFLITTPGLVIRDRLRALLPNDPENYYEHRDLVPRDMLSAVKQAQVVITNFHAFGLRERESIPANTRRLLQGRGGQEIDTKETEGQMLRRVMPELMRMKNVLVLNDEGHHCYRQRPEEESTERSLEADEVEEAERNNEYARVWISGIEMVKRHIGTVAVLDLSATPFFLRGSGYVEGTLFPWTVCDFSLMDAIESGIVKIPRVPVDDNALLESRPVFRELWRHVGGELPRAGRRRANVVQDPRELPSPLISALEALYVSYERTYKDWQEAGIESLPVFIVVCQNTAISKLIYEYIAGFERSGEDGSEGQKFLGRFDLIRNYDDNGSRLPLPRTLLIDSEQLGAADNLPPGFHAAAAPAIERFRRERVQRDGDRSAADSISVEDILREMMNTVGKPGRLGAGIRCVVSVSMLTEGWDANTVTHILGVRAFGTQLLCEQVVGRALRRRSYDLNEDGLFGVEYADILGVPFDFTNSDKPPPPPKPPAQTVRVFAVSPERDHLEITFPNVTAYRVQLPDEYLNAHFNEDSVLRLSTELVGPTRTENQGIIGEGTELTVERLRETRRGKIVFELTAHILQNHLREPGEAPKMHLFSQLSAIVGRWLDGYLRCDSETYPAQVLYREIADRAGQRIKAAIANAVQAEQPDAVQLIKAVVAPYNPTGSTRYVNFTTSVKPRQASDRFRRQILETGPDKCHVNRAVCDTQWEAALCRIVDEHPKVLSYVRNYGLGLEVPYRIGPATKSYEPDFIVQIDDGQGAEDPLNLIVEVKGYRGEDAAAKADTMKAYWIPGSTTWSATDAGRSTRSPRPTTLPASSTGCWTVSPLTPWLAALPTWAAANRTWSTSRDDGPKCPRDTAGHLGMGGSPPLWRCNTD